jgi:hypothetical protein
LIPALAVNAQVVVSALLPAVVALRLPVAAEEIILPAETIDMSVTTIVPPPIGITSAVIVTVTMNAVIAMAIVVTVTVNVLVIVPAALKTASAILKRNVARMTGIAARMTGSAAKMIGSVARKSLLPMAKTGKVRNSNYRRSNPHQALGLPFTVPLDPVPSAHDELDTAE